MKSEWVSSNRVPVSRVEEVTAVHTKSPIESWSLRTTTGRRLDVSTSENGNGRSTTSPTRYIVPNLILGGTPDGGHTALLQAFHSQVSFSVSSPLSHEIDEVENFIHRLIWNVLQMTDYGFSVCHSSHITHSSRKGSTLPNACSISRSSILLFLPL